MSGVFRRLYGAGPQHLVLHLAGFAIAGFALAQIIKNDAWVNFLAFFIGAALLHDVVLLPIYAAIDKLGLMPIHHKVNPRLPVPMINHVRAPAVIGAMLLLIYLPLISGKSDASLRAASGHVPHGYLGNWLLITAALFVGSGLIYALRTWRSRRSAA